MITSCAIIGGGFSGTLVALHLLARAPDWARIALIERNAQFGKGQAYGTGNPSHLLNVPAGRMSAFHQNPSGFIDWLRAQHVATDDCAPAPEPGSFVPRREFGAYVRYLLNEEIKRPEIGDRLDLVRADVLDIESEDAPLRLVLDRDRRLLADIAVLALGNFPPEPPPVETPAFYNSGLYRADPWAPDSLCDLDPADPVLLIGTGLTTVDAVITLLDRRHVGPIHAISRRGLLPLAHGAPTGASAPAPLREPFAYPTRVTALSRLIRRESERARAATGAWQPAIDALRPCTVDLWQAMSFADRDRFLRHLRPWWDIHRHRIPPEVATRIAQARRSGQLHIAAGRMRRFRDIDDQVEVTWRRRGKADELETLFARRVVNCAGPGADYDRISHPLARALLSRGVARPDELRLGLDVSTSCALIDRTGAVSRRLFAIGPVTKGRFWEMTAVPDIRRQCEVLASTLAPLLQRPAGLS